MPSTRRFAKEVAEKLFAVDPEIERTYHRRIRDYQRQQREETENMADQPGVPLQQIPPIVPQRIALKDRTRPNALDYQSSITEPEVVVPNFELKPGLIQMIQQSQFGGGINENPQVHIAKFLQLCNTLKMNGVADEAIRLRLFPFSLRDRASEWLMSMPPNSFTNWEALSAAFLAKYFPPAKTVRIRNEINNFTQKDGESLYEAWERLKDLERQCPHHGVPRWMVIENFYNGLEQSVRSSIDSAAGGSLMGKTEDEAYTLIEDMALHNYQYGNVRSNTRRQGMYEVEAFNALNARFDQLTMRLDRMNMNPVAATTLHCELCGGGHQTSDCPAISQDMSMEQANVTNSFQPRPIGNQYSNTYNPGWRNHPNFLWSNQQQTNTSTSQGIRAPGFAPRTFAAPPVQNPPQKSRLEELMEGFIISQQKTNEDVKGQIQQMASKMEQLSSGMEQLRTHNKVLENQIVQLASNQSQRNFGKLPSQPELNPREEVNAITLRSGKEVEMKESNNEQLKESDSGEVVEKQVNPSEPIEKESPYVPPPPYKPPLPFPQRVQEASMKKQFEKVLDTLKKLSINISFLEALSQMPSYVKFLKELLSSKRKLEEYGTVALTEECSALL